MARIGKNVGVVPRPVHQVAASLSLNPGRAVVIGTIQTTFFAFRLDQGPNAAGLRRGNGDADLAQWPGGQALVSGNLGPGIAAIG